MNQTTHIHLQQCARTFHPNNQVLKPLDLEIYQGETLVLLGPSGCGKTTTLRLISGLEQPDHGGKIFFNDQDVTHLPIEKRHVGMVFQHYALFPNFTVGQNVAYALKIQKLPADEIKARVEEMLAMVDLAGYHDRNINTLSGGQKQRVSLARALAARPKILLFDEPLAALDVKLKDKLREDIKKLLKGLGITAIYVTHDQQEAMALGDRIAVMQHGEIEQIGTAKDIYQHPETAFVAHFVGSTNHIRINDKTLFCRPEDILLNQQTSAFSHGQVSQITFLGQTQKLIVTDQNNQTLTVTCSPHEQWHVGQHVSLHISPERLFHAT
ncbi:ABC transporter ATP-binding protein [Acinetobacter rathckeae]|uniref:ABC transporter ATP-binding protein n=1 Tax=Acinetobacter rathckeae TaxID=2605272 RepID=UPI0018A25934|nr:ABC transporter ATP-binding protein [Acinetobacter rathckeae]MBF7687204.1 ABC transporter ATP-binding protein [Acinetobacter rathckeae]MBF7694443.1 ABC transporter ATP-binding protein [Acinetobacter rathckeae]